MRRLTPHLPARRVLLGAALFLQIVATSAAVIWLLSANARREIDGLAVANADSSQWSLAQSEVEFQALQIAMSEAQETTGDLWEVRRRFDILYSRVQTIKESQTFDDIRESEEFKGAIDQIDAFLTHAIPFIDGPDDGLQAAIPTLYSELTHLRGELRAISLAGVRLFATRSENQRVQVAGALQDLGLIAFALLAILLAVVAYLLLLMRSSRLQNLAIAQTENRLQAMVSTSLDAIVVVDRWGRMLDFNGAAERIFGYSREEAIGADMASMIIPDKLRDAHDAGMARYRDTGERRVVGSGLIQLEAKRKDGTTFPVEFSINSADSMEGEIFVSYIRDISQRVANEQELVDARDKALAGEKAKAELLAVMSHEMRTPLNGVLGTLQLLADTPLNDKQKKFINVMDSSGQLLMQHVNNVLDISRVDAGKLQAAQAPFDLTELVQGVVDSLRNQADERGNTLGATFMGPHLSLVLGDETRLRQVLVNLLANAIKFTENGQIIVEVEAEPTGSHVNFRIIDTGIGIDEGDFDRIFDDFVTLDTSYRREVEGTGLGLGIVRRLVGLMGGTIEVESEIGEGSVFLLRLPLERAEAVQAASEPPRPVAGHGLSVLVVEDNEVNHLVVGEMLEKLGCNVTRAADGQEGVDLAQAQEFDLILMDISMPRMDGTTATRLIRETGRNTATTIVAMTAHALPDDIQRFHDLGMADVLTKPVAFDRLDAILRAVSGVGSTVEQAADADFSLVDTLGQDQAAEISQWVQREMASGFAELHELATVPDRHAELQALAHKLAGAAAIVGLTDLRAALIALEQAEPHAVGELLQRAEEARHAAA